MHNPKFLEFLKKNNLTIGTFSKLIDYDREHISDVTRKKIPASRRLMRTIIKATDGHLDESDFILSRYDC